MFQDFKNQKKKINRPLNKFCSKLENNFLEVKKNFLKIKIFKII